MPRPGDSPPRPGDAVKKRDEAARAYARLIPLTPDRPEGYRGLARCLRWLERFDDSAACLMKGLARLPDHAGMTLDLAAVRLEQWRLDEAARILEEYLGRHGDETGALARLEETRATMELLRTVQKCESFTQ